jgi:hydrogenase maturation protease
MCLTETDPPVLVIGYGNALRGDDGAGPAAAEALRRRLPHQAAEVLAVHQLLPELSQRLSRSQLAIFIDADWNTPAGQVRKKVIAAQAGGASSVGHHQSPELLLTMAQSLYAHAPEAILFQVGAADFGFQQGLSTPVRQAIGLVVQQVVDAVQQAAGGTEYHHA